MSLVRLNKHLKDIGLCSRRKADEFIANGFIKVNGAVICELGYKINPLQDVVTISNDAHKVINEFVYIVLNKPIGYVCSRDANEGKTIYDLLPSDITDNLAYAGRLDKDSSGLVILSNDGKFVYSVFNKLEECEKEYLVTVNKPIHDEYLYQQSHGLIRLDGKIVRRAKVWQTGIKSYGMILTEGMNRQIRRMAENQGYVVTKLKRVRIGSVTDHGLDLSTWRFLTADEIGFFK